MIEAFVGGLAVAGVNIAVGRWLQKSNGTDKQRFWSMQALGVALRFVMIFAVASAVWSAHRQMPEVAVFILTGAVVQMIGQIYLLTRDKKPHA